LQKKEKKSLEESLIEKNLLSRDNLKKALEGSKKSGEPVRKSLVKMGFVKEEDLLAIYQSELNIPRANLTNLNLSPKLLSIIPENVARKSHILPILKSGKTLSVAMSDPLDIIILDELRLKTGCNVEPAVATEEEITNAINKLYGIPLAGTIEEVIKALDTEAVNFEAAEEIDPSKLHDMAEEAPIIKLVNVMISNAIKDRASDIHVEPEETDLKIRNRIDGVLHDSATVPKHLQAAVLSRIKIMSDMNIALKRTPQDGRFQLKTEKGSIDFRVSSFPTIYGENIVMRILDSSSVLLGLEQLGFYEDHLANIKKLIELPHGILLVTGPTGSGKTTTLYSALNTINSPDKNIITVEDPVEYRLTGIRQSQINPQAGMTFATGLRSILRQDPDVIMVGEIRDLETAEIAIQAALTGHLVFSTLHTNDAPSSLTRLIDMGVEPFLISSSVVGVLAQRLVRKICPHCKEEFKESAKALEELGANLKNKDAKTYIGKGCPECKNTGYRGRIGIFELMVISDKIKEMIIAKTSASVIAKTAREEGMLTLREDGVRKILDGATSVEEVVRVTMND
jgi:type IV pilus assembly protein PilB